MNLIEKLRAMVSELEQLAEKSEDGLKAHDHWQLAQRLMGRMPVDQAELKRVCTERDLPGFDALVNQLENPGEPAEPKAEVKVSERDMADAIKAFRKRLKVMRLNDESKLGGHYTTGGRKSNIDAIEPPREFKPAVWKALAKAGKLRDTGRGFYALPYEMPTDD
ncbi:MAG: hypothetical protein ACI89L_002607 [Phycisphaerales bacterium]|jgi:hypothetical protein